MAQEVIFDNLFDNNVKEKIKSEVNKLDGVILDWKEISNQELINNKDFLIINIQDSWTYENLNTIISKINNLKKKVFITTTGKSIFRTEKYLLPLARWLKENKYEFEILGIPLCYAQDYLDKHYDTRIFLQYPEFNFGNYMHYEDCRFCKVRNICPGALKHYENQVYAVFKDNTLQYDDSLFMFTKENLEENKLKRYIDENAKVWILPQYPLNNDMKIVEVLKQITSEIYFGSQKPQDLEYIKRYRLKPIEFKERSTYKQVLINGKEIYIKTHLEFDVFDSIVIINHKNIKIHNVVFELIPTNELKKIELTEENLEKLYKVLKYKIHAIYVQE